MSFSFVEDGKEQETCDVREWMILSLAFQGRLS